MGANLFGMDNYLAAHQSELPQAFGHFTGILQVELRLFRWAQAINWHGQEISPRSPIFAGPPFQKGAI